MHQRGSTLIEVVIVAAVIAMLAAAALGLSVSANPAAMRTAATQFDAALNYTRALAAASGNGATLTISGGSIAVYSGRPTSSGTLRSAGMPAVAIPGVGVREATAGSTPLAVFVDSAGHLSMETFSGATPAPLGQEPACPASGRWVVTFTDSRSQESRSFACNAPLFGGS